MSSPSGFKPNGGPSALATCLSFFLFFFHLCHLASNGLELLKKKNHITSLTPRVVTCASHCPPLPCPPTVAF